MNADLDQDVRFDEDELWITGRLRRPWLAALLSLCAPGLGQIYAGWRRRGITVALAYALGMPVLAVVFCEWDLPPWNALLTLVPLPLLQFWIVIDAVRVARRGNRLGTTPSVRWYRHLGWILLAVSLCGGWFILVRGH